ncbi:hypothetical protein P3342_011522 [Pyrenophora teres f. teres]|nr:hypothetical protein P3342_011522 [Pyrenophora teres f. teres]
MRRAGLSPRWHRRHHVVEKAKWPLILKRGEIQGNAMRVASRLSEAPEAIARALSDEPNQYGEIVLSASTDQQTSREGHNGDKETSISRAILV